MIKQVIWSSMIDYPKHVSTVIFFDRCNFNCDYCYNKELINMKKLDFDKDILPKLLSRKEIVDHIILSGGECTISNSFSYIVDKLYDNGFTIGIHTNGSHPDIIEKHINKISYLGIDIKTSNQKYNDITKTQFDIQNIIDTINLAKDNNKEYQCRTTLYPIYVKKEDCIEIAKKLKKMGVGEYTIQQCYNIGSSQTFNSYSDKELIDIQNGCDKIIKTNLKMK